MIKHLFKLIWNKKKKNFLLITEMFFSFLVMFAIFTLIVYSWHNYNKPMGFDYKDVWAASFTPPEIANNDSAILFKNTLKQTISSMPEIEEVSFVSFNIPFSMSTNSTEISRGSLRHVRTNSYQAEMAYKKLLNLKMVSGRWFAKEDNVDHKYTPVVINEKLKDELFGNEDAVGKLIGAEEIDNASPADRFRVVGVMQDIKDKGDYQAIENEMFNLVDTNDIRNARVMLLKVRSGANAAFENKLSKVLAKFTGNSVNIEHLDQKRESKNKVVLVPLIIALIVAGFLIINVSLGLFGVLWYNINKRKGEIGLRRAVGASGRAVSSQLVYESVILATFSLAVGLVFAVQFPLLNVFDLPANVYIQAITLAVIFIYLLVLICALYPGRQASYIYPAVALHED
jgi:putative ABC transport system permease protein